MILSIKALILMWFYNFPKVFISTQLYILSCKLCTVASCVLFFSDFIISYTFECEPFFSIACPENVLKY